MFWAYKLLSTLIKSSSDELPLSLLQTKLSLFLYRPIKEQTRILFNVFASKSTGVVNVDDLAIMVSILDNPIDSSYA